MKALTNEKLMVGRKVKAVYMLEMREEGDVVAHAFAIVFDDETVVLIQGDDPYDPVSAVKNDWEIKRCMKEVRREEARNR